MDLTAPFYQFGALGPGSGLVVAVLIGAAFGFFLERGGLGNGRKLASQFYLNDLTVFKVMFTAILTALLGLFWLGQVGVLDTSLILLSPTYLVPQIVGGLLFGAGFVIGGYCPGTSCIAVASGKLDALAVFGGMMAGILVYGEVYPSIRPFAESTSMGRISLPELLSVRPGVMVAAVTMLALGGFVLADRIEKRRGNRLVQPE
ncbi:MAG: DUF6691 family protein [Gemmatimonadota bacterium]